MKLLFVLTFKGSLEKWAHNGIANREMEFCFEYLRRDFFSEIVIFSYSADDKKFLNALNFEPELKARIKLIMPNRRLKSFWDYLFYSFSIGKIRQAIKEGVVICRTNQINGSWTALLAKMFGCPVLLRCGYILSRGLFKKGNWPRGFLALIIEIVGFNLASLISVTTQNAASYVSHCLLGRKERIFIAPTYVNTEIFNAEVSKKPKRKKILFVGRLETVKNVLSLVDACRIADASLTIVGRGSLEREVLKRAKEIDLSLTHYPSLLNEEIVNLFKTHRYFAISSLHEGMPKALIEAMAAEMICIGTPTSGINDLIIPHKTGYLAADFTPEALAKALRMAFEDPNAESYGRAARTYVLEHHAIACYVDREYARIKELLI